MGGAETAHPITAGSGLGPPTGPAGDWPGCAGSDVGGRSRMLSSAQLPSGSSPERGHRRTSGRGGSGPVTCSRASTRPAGRGRAPPGRAQGPAGTATLLPAAASLGAGSSGPRREAPPPRPPAVPASDQSAEFGPQQRPLLPGRSPAGGAEGLCERGARRPGAGAAGPASPCGTGANGVPAGRTSAGPGAEARSSSGSGRRLLTRRRSASGSAAPGPAARRPGAARGAEVWPRPDLGGGRLRPFAPGGSVTARARRRGGRGASTSAALRPPPPRGRSSFINLKK